MAVKASVTWSSVRGMSNLFGDKDGNEPGSGGLSSMKSIADKGQIGVCAHCNTKQQVVQRSFSSVEWESKRGLAAVYSHTGSPPHYHRRWWTLLPGSGWDRVFPHRSCHQLLFTHAGCKVRVVCDAHYTCHALCCMVWGRAADAVSRGLPGCHSHCHSSGTLRTEQDKEVLL